MAKQTFTVGQVLSAANMTNLQQTAMGGGSTTAKTVSYVLVAADAGTVVQMNSASATTITLNSALFAAGDSVQIQNVGAGICTVTAGTATVSTSATLALKQYDAGTLYFNTTSAAFFFAVDAADTPLTTTGDIIYSSSGSTAARLGIGSASQVLTVAAGIPSWATPAAGGGKVLQVVTATTSTSTNIASTTFTDTTLSATITPTLNTSKVLILVSQQMYAYRDTGGIGGAARLVRGSSSIYALGTDYQTAYVNAGSAHATVFPMAYLDSPATTSATTYKTQARSNSALNSGSVTMQESSAVSSIVLMEIGA